MGRSVLAALLATVLLAVPVSAQLFPSGPGSAPPLQPAPGGERVLVDTTLYVNPPKAEGLCMTVDAGLVTITARRVKDAVVERRPASLSFRGFMADPTADATMTIGDAEASTTTRVNGAHFYCWSVSIEAPETQGMSNAQRGGYVQTVAVRITLTP